MKKFLILMIVIFVAFQFIGYGQTGFDVLWKIDNWGATHGASVTQMARFAPDGKSIFFVVENGSGDKSVVFQVSAETGADISQSERIDKIYDFDMSEAGNIYVTLYSKSTVGIWDAKSHKLLDSINTNVSTRVAILNIAISPDEKFLIYNYVKKSGNNSSYIIAVYDITEKKIIKEITSIRCTELRYSRDGKTFVAGGVAEVINDNGEYVKKERLILYDATTWEEEAVLAGINYASGFKNIHYSFDGKFVAATGTNIAVIADVATLQTRQFFNDATYGNLRGLQLLQAAKDYYIIYSDNTAIRYVIYNDDKVVNSYPKDYWHVVTGNPEGKFRIFVDYSYLTGDMIGVLKPSPTSVKENEESILFVNYSENVLSVSYSGLTTQTAKIIISDVSGKEVYSGAVGLNESGKTPVPLKLENGIYLYRIVLNNQEFTGKFEVVR